MATAEREQLMTAYLDAWNSHDPAAVAAFFASDAVYDDRGAGEIARGRLAIRDHVAAVLVAFPDVRFEVAKAAHGDHFTCGEWRVDMTHEGDLFGLSPTGRHIESAGVDIATLDEAGQVTYLVSYYDGAALMRQLGLLPDRGSRTERILLRVASLLPRRP